jgi:hypothetical protein
MNAALRAFYRPHLGDDCTAADLRRLLDVPHPVARGCRAEPDTLGGVSGEWVTRTDGNDSKGE